MKLNSGLREFSVVYTDRALNLMSPPFQKVMQDISKGLKTCYHAQHVAIIPGSGSFAMEAVARQFATSKEVMVIRNGFFSFRWSAIFDQGHIPSSHSILKAQNVENTNTCPTFAPVPLETVIATIKETKPAVVFAPHVETATGIILPDDYLKSVAEAVHLVGGLFVLDCIASGCIWVNMEETGVDVIISAPQKGWSSPACCGVVLLNDRAKEQVNNTQSDSFCLDLKKWLEVMSKYEAGSFMYYTTLPTDALAVFRDSITETETFGFEKTKQCQWELGNKVREGLEHRGYSSVAAKGYKAPGVIVSYSPENNMVPNLLKKGVQIAAGVPFQINEPEGLITFRVGLFGLDKLNDVEGTCTFLMKTIDEINSKL
jgi:aspartate aminotransferase-like enzyme